MALFVTVCNFRVNNQPFLQRTLRTVFGNVVEVVPANDDRAVHFRGDDTAGEDTATDGDVTSERALLVCVKFNT